MQKTLIVDDITVFRETFKNALRDRFPSMNIEEAVNGREAMDKIAHFQPDLVFMDIRMPGESGISITEKIKAQYPKIIVIILTDYDLPEYREAARQCGADDFIHKGSLKMSEIKKLLDQHQGS